VVPPAPQLVYTSVFAPTVVPEMEPLPQVIVIASAHASFAMAEVVKLELETCENPFAPQS